MVGYLGPRPLHRTILVETFSGDFHNKEPKVPTGTDRPVLRYFKLLWSNETWKDDSVFSGMVPKRFQVENIPWTQ